MPTDGHEMRDIRERDGRGGGEGTDEGMDEGNNAEARMQRRRTDVSDEIPGGAEEP